MLCAALPKALGFDVPATLLARADDEIEWRGDLLQCMSPLLAHFGRHSRTRECLLLGEGRKS
jgi:hypothetical protein